MAVRREKSTLCPRQLLTCITRARAHPAVMHLHTRQQQQRNNAQSAPRLFVNAFFIRARTENTHSHTWRTNSIHISLRACVCVRACMRTSVYAQRPMRNAELALTKNDQHPPCVSRFCVACVRVCVGDGGGRLTEPIRRTGANA